MKIILWDWDNTLADTIEPLLTAYNAVLRDYNRPCITREEMKSYMNFAGRQLFLDLFPNENFDEVRQKYLHYYQQGEGQIHLMSGAESVLKWTKENGFINLLASNKHYMILAQEAEATGLSSYFSGICGAEQFSENKPSKAFTDEVLKNYSNWQSLFSVGDGVSDIKMAHNYENGQAILVGTNPTAKEFENNPPDFSVKNLGEIPEILSQQVS